MPPVLSNLKLARCALAAAWLSGCSSPPPPKSPFTDAETNQALAPVRGLRAHCYDSSALAQAHQKIVLDFELEVEPSGTVRAIPKLVQPKSPEVVECVRA